MFNKSFLSRVIFKGATSRHYEEVATRTSADAVIGAPAVGEVCTFLKFNPRESSDIVAA